MSQYNAKLFKLVMDNTLDLILVKEVMMSEKGNFSKNADFFLRNLKAFFLIVALFSRYMPKVDTFG